MGAFIERKLNAVQISSITFNMFGLYYQIILIKGGTSHSPVTTSKTYKFKHISNKQSKTNIKIKILLNYPKNSIKTALIDG